MAFGLSVSAEEGKPRAVLSSFLGSLAAASIVAVTYDPLRLPPAIPALVCALALVLFADDRGLATSKACLLIIMAAAATLGSSAVVAATQGTSVSAVIEEYASAVSAAAGGSQGLGLREKTAYAVFLVKTYWPLAYLADGGLLVLFSKFGRNTCLRGKGLQPRRTPLADFDLPLWVLPAFIAGFVLSAAASQAAGLPAELDFAGRNLLAGTRVFLFVQGAAVTVGFLRKRGAGVVTQAAAMMVAAWLELSFVIVSAVGAIDLVANFRGLPRGLRDTR